MSNNGTNVFRIIHVLVRIYHIIFIIFLFLYSFQFGFSFDFTNLERFSKISRTTPPGVARVFEIFFSLNFSPLENGEVRYFYKFFAISKENFKFFIRNCVPTYRTPLWVLYFRANIVTSFLDSTTPKIRILILILFYFLHLVFRLTVLIKICP